MIAPRVARTGVSDPVIASSGATGPGVVVRVTASAGAIELDTGAGFVVDSPVVDDEVDTGVATGGNETGVDV